MLCFLSRIFFLPPETVLSTFDWGKWETTAIIAYRQDRFLQDKSHRYMGQNSSWKSFKHMSF